MMGTSENRRIWLCASSRSRILDHYYRLLVFRGRFRDSGEGLITPIGGRACPRREGASSIASQSINVERRSNVSLLRGVDNRPLKPSRDELQALNAIGQDLDSDGIGDLS
jgi:hypothetical protein